MPKQYNAQDIARYFLAKTDPDVGEIISNLKLQKLCYYAQGLAVATRGVPLFQDELQAWLHGPVVPGLYQEYRDYKSSAIPPVADLDLDAYDRADRMILDDVHEHFGQYSAWRLREMTHLEAPWKDAYAAGANHVISHDALKAYFSNEVSAEYIEQYEQISQGERA